MTTHTPSTLTRTLAGFGLIALATACGGPDAPSPLDPADPTALDVPAASDASSDGAERFSEQPAATTAQRARGKKVLRSMMGLLGSVRGSGRIVRRRRGARARASAARPQGARAGEEEHSRNGGAG